LAPPSEGHEDVASDPKPSRGVAVADGDPAGDRADVAHADRPTVINEDKPASPASTSPRASRRSTSLSTTTQSRGRATPSPTYSPPTAGSGARQQPPALSSTPELEATWWAPRSASARRRGEEPTEITSITSTLTEDGHSRTVVEATPNGPILERIQPLTLSYDLVLPVGTGTVSGTCAAESVVTRITVEPAD
jgi:hypothetical protein